ncbi:hypothetical protein KIPB_001937 [Kipferlia bialata]|uniref:BEACH domain-containing protein n=1 Tax=Kipferlia bialata TaxID=797122 RepID=A0A9K3GEH6_9EUKA|nr:hypothetical protein KIPB_001937 [Kipferlia bialata]|eukprot:g1937.t1
MTPVARTISTDSRIEITEKPLDQSVLNDFFMSSSLLDDAMPLPYDTRSLVQGLDQVMDEYGALGWGAGSDIFTSDLLCEIASRVVTMDTNTVPDVRVYLSQFSQQLQLALMAAVSASDHPHSEQCAIEKYCLPLTHLCHHPDLAAGMVPTASLLAAQLPMIEGLVKGVVYDFFATFCRTVPLLDLAHALEPRDRRRVPGLYSSLIAAGEGFLGPLQTVSHRLTSTPNGPVLHLVKPLARDLDHVCRALVECPSHACVVCGWGTIVRLLTCPTPLHSVYEAQSALTAQLVQAGLGMIGVAAVQGCHHDDPVFCSTRVPALRLPSLTGSEGDQPTALFRMIAALSLRPRRHLDHPSPLSFLTTSCVSPPQTAVFQLHTQTVGVVQMLLTLLLAGPDEVSATEARGYELDTLPDPMACPSPASPTLQRQCVAALRLIMLGNGDNVRLVNAYSGRVGQPTVLYLLAQQLPRLCPPAQQDLLSLFLSLYAEGAVTHRLHGIQLTMHHGLAEVVADPRLSLPIRLGLVHLLRVVSQDLACAVVTTGALARVLESTLEMPVYACDAEGEGEGGEADADCGTPSSSPLSPYLDAVLSLSSSIVTGGTATAELIAEFNKADKEGGACALRVLFAYVQHGPHLARLRILDDLPCLVPGATNEVVRLILRVLHDFGDMTSPSLSSLLAAPPAPFGHSPTPTPHSSHLRDTSLLETRRVIVDCLTTVLLRSDSVSPDLPVLCVSWVEGFMALISHFLRPVVVSLDVSSTATLSSQPLDPGACLSFLLALFRYLTVVLRRFYASGEDCPLAFEPLSDVVGVVLSQTHRSQGIQGIQGIQGTGTGCDVDLSLVNRVVGSLLAMGTRHSRPKGTQAQCHKGWECPQGLYAPDDPPMLTVGDTVSFPAAYLVAARAVSQVLGLTDTDTGHPEATPSASSPSHPDADPSTRESQPEGLSGEEAGGGSLSSPLQLYLDVVSYSIARSKHSGTNTPLLAGHGLSRCMLESFTAVLVDSSRDGFQDTVRCLTSLLAWHTSPADIRVLSPFLQQHTHLVELLSAASISRHAPRMWTTLSKGVALKVGLAETKGPLLSRGWAVASWCLPGSDPCRIAEILGPDGESELCVSVLSTPDVCVHVQTKTGSVKIPVPDLMPYIWGHLTVSCHSDRDQLLEIPRMTRLRANAGYLQKQGGPLYGEGTPALTRVAVRPGEIPQGRQCVIAVYLCGVLVNMAWLPVSRGVVGRVSVLCGGSLSPSRPMPVSLGRTEVYAESLTAEHVWSLYLRSPHDLGSAASSDVSVFPGAIHWQTATETDKDGCFCLTPYALFHPNEAKDGRKGTDGLGAALLVQYTPQLNGTPQLSGTAGSKDMRHAADRSLGAALVHSHAGFVVGTEVTLHGPARRNKASGKTKALPPLESLVDVVTKCPPGIAMLHSRGEELLLLYVEAALHASDCKHAAALLRLLLSLCASDVQFYQRFLTVHGHAGVLAVIRDNAACVQPILVDAVFGGLGVRPTNSCTPESVPVQDLDGKEVRVTGYLRDLKGIRTWLGDLSCWTDAPVETQARVLVLITGAARFCPSNLGILRARGSRGVWHALLDAASGNDRLVPVFKDPVLRPLVMACLDAVGPPSWGSWGGAGVTARASVDIAAAFGGALLPLVYCCDNSLPSSPMGGAPFAAEASVSETMSDTMRQGGYLPLSSPPMSSVGVPELALSASAHSGGYGLRYAVYDWLVTVIDGAAQSPMGREALRELCIAVSDDEKQVPPIHIPTVVHLLSEDIGDARMRASALRLLSSVFSALPGTSDNVASLSDRFVSVKGMDVVAQSIQTLPEAAAALQLAFDPACVRISPTCGVSYMAPVETTVHDASHQTDTPRAWMNQPQALVAVGTAILRLLNSPGDYSGVVILDRVASVLYAVFCTVPNMLSVLLPAEASDAEAGLLDLLLRACVQAVSHLDMADVVSVGAAEVDLSREPDNPSPSPPVVPTESHPDASVPSHRTVGDGAGSSSPVIDILPRCIHRIMAICALSGRYKNTWVLERHVAVIRGGSADRPEVALCLLGVLCSHILSKVQSTVEVYTQWVRLVKNTAYRPDPEQIRLLRYHVESEYTMLDCLEACGLVCVTSHILRCHSQLESAVRQAEGTQGLSLLWAGVDNRLLQLSACLTVLDDMPTSSNSVSGSTSAKLPALVQDVHAQFVYCEGNDSERLGESAGLGEKEREREMPLLRRMGAVPAVDRRDVPFTHVYMHHALAILGRVLQSGVREGDVANLSLLLRVLIAFPLSRCLACLKKSDADVVGTLFMDLYLATRSTSDGVDTLSHVPVLALPPEIVAEGVTAAASLLSCPISSPLALSDSRPFLLRVRHSAVHAKRRTSFRMLGSGSLVSNRVNTEAVLHALRKACAFCVECGAAVPPLLPVNAAQGDIRAGLNADTYDGAAPFISTAKRLDLPHRYKKRCIRRLKYLDSVSGALGSLIPEEVVPWVLAQHDGLAEHRLHRLLDRELGHSKKVLRHRRVRTVKGIQSRRGYVDRLATGLGPFAAERDTVLRMQQRASLLLGGKAYLPSPDVSAGESTLPGSSVLTSTCADYHSQGVPTCGQGDRIDIGTVQERGCVFELQDFIGPDHLPQRVRVRRLAARQEPAFYRMQSLPTLLVGKTSDPLFDHSLLHSSGELRFRSLCACVTVRGVSVGEVLVKAQRGEGFLHYVSEPSTGGPGEVERRTKGDKFSLLACILRACQHSPPPPSDDAPVSEYEAGLLSDQTGSVVSVALAGITHLFAVPFLGWDCACVLYTVAGRQLFLVFQTSQYRDTFLKLLQTRLAREYLPMLSFAPRDTDTFLADTTQAWREGKVSTLSYTMCLNVLSGRSYAFRSQYPVVPQVLADYTSAELDLTNPASFRDLERPIHCRAYNEGQRRMQYQESLDNLDRIVSGTGWHCGTFYSNVHTTTHSLVRLEPFAALQRQLQSGAWDAYPRMFHSVADYYENNHAGRVGRREPGKSEMVPQFYCLPEFLVNCNGYSFVDESHPDMYSGQAQMLGRGGLPEESTGSEQEAGFDVSLPPWGPTALSFVSQHRAALECDRVGSAISSWFDLTFGPAQPRDSARALNACNSFQRAAYPFTTDFSAYVTQLQTALGDANEEYLKMTLYASFDAKLNFGTVPKQLFSKPHPTRLSHPVPSPIGGALRVGAAAYVSAYPVAGFARSVEARSTLTDAGHWPGKGGRFVPSDVQLGAGWSGILGSPRRLRSQVSRDTGETGALGELTAGRDGMGCWHLPPRSVVIPPFTKYVLQYDQAGTGRIRAYDVNRDWPDRPTLRGELDPQLNGAPVTCMGIGMGADDITVGGCGYQVYVGTAWGSVLAYDLSTATMRLAFRQQVTSHRGRVTALEVSQAYRAVVSGDDLGTVQVVMFSGNIAFEASACLEGSGAVSALAVCPQSGCFAAAIEQTQGTTRSHIYVWTLNGVCLGMLDVTDDVTCLAFAPGPVAGRQPLMLLVGTACGDVSVVSFVPGVSDPTVTRTVSRASALALVKNTNTSTTSGQRRGGGRVTALLGAPDGTCVLVGYSDGLAARLDPCGEETQDSTGVSGEVDHLGPAERLVGRNPQLDDEATSLRSSI